MTKERLAELLFNAIDWLLIDYEGSQIIDELGMSEEEFMDAWVFYKKKIE